MDLKNPITLSGIGLIGVGIIVSFMHVKTLISNACLMPGIYAGLGIFSFIGGYYLISKYSDNWSDETSHTNVDSIKEIIAS